MVRVYGSFHQYIDCEDVLKHAVSKTSNYAELKEYMSEEIYNNLSIKTKSLYSQNQIWDGKICVLSQKEDEDDPDIVYLDVAILYDDGTNLVIYPWIEQLILRKNHNSWKIIKVIEPWKKWYSPFYLGNVYFFAFPE